MRRKDTRRTNQTNGLCELAINVVQAPPPTTNTTGKGRRQIPAVTDLARVANLGGRGAESHEANFADGMQAKDLVGDGILLPPKTRIPRHTSQRAPIPV